MTKEEDILEQKQFFEHFEKAIQTGAFIRINLSKPHQKNSDLKKIRIHFSLENNLQFLLFTYSFTHKNNTEKLPLFKGFDAIKVLLKNTFQVATLFTSKADFSLQINKNGKQKLHKRPPSLTAFSKESNTSIPDFLEELGIIDTKGNTRKGKGDKLKQINKFVEIMAGLLEKEGLINEKKELRIVDMGSGKGYLTFALYEYITNTLQKKTAITGVEVRQNLVELCTTIAQKVQFEKLSFAQGYIGNYPLPETDVLIALHACDTATDDAIFKGIQAGAQLIICAPCCHKQIRKQINCTTHLESMLQYGIFKERMGEMITDSIRALLLEANGYSTKVFEFISTDHTGKNVLIVAEKRALKSSPKQYLVKIENLKTEFGIKFHYLEKLLEKVK